jgi:nucleotidyltransferase/DNA polymerase involved in DNA repair
MKATYANEVKKFSDIPNVGPAMTRDFTLLGITSPRQLAKKDPYKLYKQLEK